MLYHLSGLSGFWSPFNLFQYITFRAGGAALTAMGLSLLVGPALIAVLRRRKIGQIQRTDGPASHMGKHGTPTMGGALIFLAVAASCLLWMRPDNRFTWLLLVVGAILAGLGVWDDYSKLVRRDAGGISSRAKLATQVTLALLVVSYLSAFPPNGAHTTMVNIPYAKELFIELGPAYFVLAALMIVGSSNAVNLTDGLDGLAAGAIIFCAIAYGVFSYAAGHVKISAYLRIIAVPGAGEIAVYMASLVGACLGFLWFNSYPAEVFMGDTGSLFLGGVIATAALCVKQELILPIVGGVFVLETLSVILQMASYKLRGGRRIFRMAPLHHHFELGGVAEPKVTVRFWIVSIVMMLAALASLKIR
ncbi:MAG: phospho-N-acetylmuramoyl-pentapeptide-transferase [Elusimicrobia bacterium]|nr:phospho-N-acetylmuramoyl-pentapeptide-transferase [Elusimicrobiota bacterium]